MDSPPADQDVQTAIDLELRLLKYEIRAEPGEVDRLLHRISPSSAPPAAAGGEPR